MNPGFELANARAQNIPESRSNPIPMCMVCIKPLTAFAYLLCAFVDKRRTDCAANMLPWVDVSPLSWR
jgi:hypothetical protein